MPVRRVLHVIPSVGPVRGGPSAMVRGLARDLSRQGIDTHVATTDDNGPDRLRVPHGVPVRQDGVTYWYFRRHTRFYTFSWTLGMWLAGHIANFDLVHIHGLFSYATLPAAFWADRHRVPYVVRPLGTLSEWSMKSRRPWLKQLSFRFIERQVLKRAAVIHYTSDQERREAEMLDVTTPAVVVPIGLPDSAETDRVTGAFRDRHPELQGRRIVLFLSRLDGKKGLDLLLPAFAKVRATVADVSLVVAGTGETGFVSRLKGQAAALGIAGDVVWPGFLEGDDKQAVFADADFFVLPSYSENFGIAAVEAMAAGLAVIVSDQVAIHREITQARAGVTVGCDVGELTDALTRLLKDSTLCRSMGEDGRALVRRNYASQSVMRKIIGAYNQITTPRVMSLMNE